MSSTRFRNSGLKCPCSAFITSLVAFVEIILGAHVLGLQVSRADVRGHDDDVFLKSTVRPLPSVRRPSSMICSSMLKTSGCAFSISSNRMTAYGRRRTAR